MQNWSVGRGGFPGMRPRRDTRFTGSALSVVDANLIHGDLRPFPCPIEKCNVGNADAVIDTIVNIEDQCDCLTFTECTQYFEDCGLYFWNDETGTPMISTPEQFCVGDGCEYAVQCPDAPPSVVASESALGQSDTAECNSHYFAYRYSYIVEIGDREFEGHWSAPSDCLLAGAIPNAIISGTPTPPNACVTRIRLYRAASGNHVGEGLNAEELGDWFVVGDFPVGALITDDLSYTQLQRPDPISPDEYGSPPSDLRSLGKTDNGVIFGIQDQCLHYTIPCRPMSFSPRRKICIPEHAGKPLLAVARGEDVYVYTDKRPVFLKGVRNNSGIGFELAVIQKQLPLVSKASVASGYRGEYFASNEGYYIWNETTMTSLTQEWFGRDDWCKMDPESISGVVVEDSLIWSTSVDAFMLTFGDHFAQISNSAGNPRRSQNLGGQILVGLDLNGLMIGATAHMLDCNNKLRFAKEGVVYCWDLCANILPANHKDKPLEEVINDCCPWRYCDYVDLDQCGNFSRGEIKFDTRTLTDGIEISLYKEGCGDRELIKTRNVTSCDHYTWPACNVSEEYFFEMTGCEVVKHVSFASSINHLINEPTPQGAVRL